MVGYAAPGADAAGGSGREGGASGDEGNLRDRRGASDRRSAAEDVRQPDPREPFRRPARRLPDRGDRHARARAAAGARLRHGRGHELQQRVGGARLPGERDRRAPAAGRRGGLPHRRLRRLRRRLRRRRGGHERQGRRPRRAVVRHVGRGRARHPGRRRPDDVVHQQDLGLRGELGIVRPVRARRPLPVLPEAGTADVGGRGGLHARRRHGVADAHRLAAERRQGGRPGADLGRRGRPRLDGDPDHARTRRRPDRRRLRRVEVRVLPPAGGEGRDQPPRLRPLGPPPRHRRRRGVRGVDAGRARLRPRLLGRPRRAPQPRHRLRPPRRGHDPDLDLPRRQRRDGRDLRRHLRLQRRRRPALPVDTPPSRRATCWARRWASACSRGCRRGCWWRSWAGWPARC